LFSTLAQITNKDEKGAGNKGGSSQASQPFQVVKNKPVAQKIDVQYVLERKIISVLLLYGNQTQDFEDLVLKENEETGALELEPVTQQAKVFEKIFLDLQEDEMAFTNNIFKDLYYAIIEALNLNPDFKLEQLINAVPPELAMEMSSILMDDERYSLSDWERKNIIPKTKDEGVAQLVSETILTLRCYLIDKQVSEIKEKTLQNIGEVNREVLEEVKDYSGLKMLLSRKLNRPI